MLFFLLFFLSAVCCEGVVVPEVFVCLSVVDLLTNIENSFVYSGVLA